MVQRRGEPYLVQLSGSTCHEGLVRQGRVADARRWVHVRQLLQGSPYQHRLWQQQRLSEFAPCIVRIDLRRGSRDQPGRCRPDPTSPRRAALQRTRRCLVESGQWHHRRRSCTVEGPVSRRRGATQGTCRPCLQNRPESAGTLGGEDRYLRKPREGGDQTRRAKTEDREAKADGTDGRDLARTLLAWASNRARLRNDPYRTTQKARELNVGGMRWRRGNALQRQAPEIQVGEAAERGRAIRAARSGLKRKTHVSHVSISSDVGSRGRLTVCDGNGLSSWHGVVMWRDEARIWTSIKTIFSLS